MNGLRNTPITCRRRIGGGEVAVGKPAQCAPAAGAEPSGCSLRPGGLTPARSIPPTSSSCTSGLCRSGLVSSHSRPSPQPGRCHGAPVESGMEHEFPAPHFEAEIKTSTLQKVYEQVRAATQTEDGRGGDRQAIASAAAAYRQSLATGRDGVTPRTSCWVNTGRPTLRGRLPRRVGLSTSVSCGPGSMSQSRWGCRATLRICDSALRRADQSLLLSPWCAV